MLRQKPERWIALAVIGCAAFLAALLTVILGHWEISPYKHLYVVRLPNATGIAPNSRVAFAGAPVGRVLKIAVIPRGPERENDGKFFYVELTVAVEKSLEIGEHAVFAVRQEGVLGAQFVAILPGSPEAKPLADGAVLYGASAVDLMEVAAQGQKLLAALQPATENLSALSSRLQGQIPPVVEKADKFLADGDRVLANLGSDENRQRLDDLLANLRVVSANLKVVSTNAKAFTATIGERPWSLFWGGDVKTLPTEQQILASPDPVPIPPVK